VRRSQERICGLDAHKKDVVACVITPAGRQVRSFRTMTGDLLEMLGWLQAQAVTHVAMESTELEAMVVNARHIKAVPGRKTDVREAEWIADLLRHGLLRANFIPDRPQRERRELARLACHSCRSTIASRSSRETELGKGESCGVHGRRGG
jgi:transposase